MGRYVSSRCLYGVPAILAAALVLSAALVTLAPGSSLRPLNPRHPVPLRVSPQSGAKRLLSRVQSQQVCDNIACYRERRSSTSPVLLVSFDAYANYMHTPGHIYHSTEHIARFQNKCKRPHALRLTAKGINHEYGAAAAQFLLANPATEQIFLNGELIYDKEIARGLNEDIWQDDDPIIAETEIFTRAARSGTMSSERRDDNKHTSRDPAALPHLEMGCLSYHAKAGRGHWGELRDFGFSWDLTDDHCNLDVPAHGHHGQAVGPGTSGPRKERVLILQRNQNRVFSDETQLQRGLEQHGMEVNALTFSNDLPWCQLAQAIHSSDVVITPHGFQVVLFLFVRNTKFIEVYPEGYPRFDAYIKVAREANIAYDAVMSDTYWLPNILQLNKWCMHFYTCRSVTKRFDIHVDDQLVQKLAMSVRRLAQQDGFIEPPLPNGLHPSAGNLNYYS